MKILVTGCDGYLGFALSNHLRNLGHEVFGIDNFSRRQRAKHSLTPSRHLSGDYRDMSQLSLRMYPQMDSIVHLAEQPSAPYSMKDFHQAAETQQENVIGTLRLLWEMKDHSPDAHLIKLGTMGVYGYDHGVTIPEGFIPETCEHYANEWSCPLDGLPFPKQPNSFYHLSKAFDSMNIEFTCKTWGLRATDLHQGIVFGLNYWDEELTRFDYDEHFGTVINRFAVQAIAGVPLTVYGAGGQTRGYLPLRDSIECITLALDNPPEAGEYRVFNQYAEYRSVLEIAEIIKKISIENVKIQHIENPRKEKEQHSYETTNENLRKLGYNPQWNFEEEIIKLLTAIYPFKDNINKSIIQPTTKW